MIGEALEAVWMVASALAAWIVAAGVAVTVGLYAVVAVGWGIWRVVRSAWGVMAPRIDSLPPLAASAGSGDQIPDGPANRPSGPPPRPATPTRIPNPHKPHRHGDPLTSSTRLKAGDSSLRSEGFLLRRQPPRPGVLPLRSYTASTGRQGQPGPEDVARRVHIAVMRGAAVARPLTDVQRQLPGNGSAVSAQLRAGEPTVDHDEFAPVPGALVLQHHPQITPRRVGYGAGERVVLDHVADGEVLDRDDLVLVNESGRQFVEEVPAPVGDPRMYAGHLPAGLLPVVRTLLLAGQVPLRLREALAVLPLMPGVGDLLASGEGHQGRDARIDTHRLISGGQRRDGVLTQQRHEPTPGTVAGHGNRGRRAARRKRTRPADVQRLGHLCQRQAAIAPLEAGAGVLGGSAGLLLALESRVLRALGEEVPERRLKMPQRLLKRDARHLGEEPELLGLLPLRQRGRRLHIGDAALLPVPGAGAFLQCLVVHEADAAERARQLGCLLVRGVEAVLESPLDLLRHASHSIRSRVSGARWVGGAACSAAARLRVRNASPSPADAEGFHARSLR